MSPARNSRAKIGFLQVFGVYLHLQVVAVAIRLCSFRKLASWMTQRFPEEPSSLEERKISATALKITSRVLRVNRRMRIFPATCLVESITLWWMLRRRKIPADLRIGVRTITGAFESHAWVELHGTVLNDIDQVPTIYTPMDIFPLPNGRGEN
ncbi:MAG: lasso peptide biosynthesis B2 protein [Desulfobacterales bacterium]|jgi:hypothetical protein